MSATFGYPLTSEILPHIVQKISREVLFNEVTRNREVSALYRTLLREMLISLSPGIKPLFNERVSFNKLKEELPLVTELLSQLEHQIATSHAMLDWNYGIRNLPFRPDKISDRWELGNLKTLFDWAIINVIDRNRKKSYSRKASDFLRWIKEKNKKGRQFISIVSSNYDVALEWELLDYGQAWNADTDIDFGVSWRDPVLDKSVVYNRPVKPVYRILKLHGSVDWLKCRRCGFLYINPTEPIYTLTYSNIKTNANSCHCGYWPLQPVLVTMSYVRKMDEPNLQEIWRNTFEELRMADEWVIVGYSLPPEDFDIRSLFLRALLSKEKKIKITVIQLDRNSEKRYDQFFGKGNYVYLDGGFDANIDKIIG